MIGTTTTHRTHDPHDDWSVGDLRRLNEKRAPEKDTRKKVVEEVTPRRVDQPPIPSSR